MIFCEINDGLLDILRSNSKGKTIVDCGAGEGLLGSLLPNVIGLDIMFQEKKRSPIHMIDCTMFPFNKDQLPVFIRPCHSDFVMETVQNNMFDKFIYVSKPENLNVDIDMTFIDQHYNMFTEDWKGEERERCYIFKKAGYVDKPVLKTYHLVKLDHWANAIWLYDDEGILRNKLGGGFPKTAKDVVILDTKEADDFPEN